jgi:alanine racemase
VSYGSIYVTSGKERIGVIPIGYGDGFRRVSGQKALIHGQMVDVVGRVCMDQCMLQLDRIPQARVGDEVVLLGEQKDQRITVDDLAARWGTINYEVVCGLADRLPRVYEESDGKNDAE